MRGYLSSIILFILISGCNFLEKEKSKVIPRNEYDLHQSYFEEVEDILKNDNTDFWGIDLYGPILIVDPKSRKIYANERDSLGFLRAEKGIFTGKLPIEISPSNTAFDWNGKRWTMLVYPLPEKRNIRNSLIIHELFHSIQTELDFVMSQGTNNHLDEKDGRVYLKLELEALQQSIQFETDWKQHVENALLFRLYRYSLYPYAKENENLLEINEGIAEYTGSMLGFNDDKELLNSYSEKIDKFYNYPTFVRSFAYQTIPVYGYYNSKLNGLWHKNISRETNLTDYFLSSFQIIAADNLEQIIDKIKGTYRFSAILREEEIREQQQMAIVEEFKNKLLDESSLTLNFINMNIQFDPRNIFPLEDYGTVYPNLRVVDDWGILTADSGALISPSWMKVIVSEPIELSNYIVKGDGWILELNENWSVEKEGNKYNLIER